MVLGARTVPKLQRGGTHMPRLAFKCHVQLTIAVSASACTLLRRRAVLKGIMK